MANLPPELGREIINSILNTPAPDDKKLHKEARRLEKEMLKARCREIEEKNNNTK
jgi:hypothetical protein